MEKLFVQFTWLHFNEYPISYGIASSMQFFYLWMKLCIIAWKLYTTSKQIIYQAQVTLNWQSLFQCKGYLSILLFVCYDLWLYLDIERISCCTYIGRWEIMTMQMFIIVDCALTRETHSVHQNTYYKWDCRRNTVWSGCLRISGS